MISNISYWTNMDMLHMIGISCVSILVYSYILKTTFKDNILFFFKRLIQVKDTQPILYSYRHICLLLVSYFLTIASFLALNIFYLIIQIYAYNKIHINPYLAAYSELNIKIIAVLCATLNIISAILYYIRNNDSFMKALKDNYCLLESILSLILCIIFVSAVKHAKPMGFVKGDFASFFIGIILSFILVDILIQKLQTKKKPTLKKILLGGNNSKIKNSVDTSKAGDIALLYNVLVCDGLTIVILFFTNVISDFTVAKSIAYISMALIFIGISKRYNSAINNIIQKKETK